MKINESGYKKSMEMPDLHRRDRNEYKNCEKIK